jgi:Na+/phosphate symporter
MLAFVQNYTDMGFFSIILFLLIGTILTMIVQASAATMAITLIMCANGWISLNWEQHLFWEKTWNHYHGQSCRTYSQYTG